VTTWTQSTSLSTMEQRGHASQWMLSLLLLTLMRMLTNTQASTAAAFYLPFPSRLPSPAPPCRSLNCLSPSSPPPQVEVLGKFLQPDETTTRDRSSNFLFPIRSSLPLPSGSNPSLPSPCPPVYSVESHSSLLLCWLCF
jgi:hypothetical protein